MASLIETEPDDLQFAGEQACFYFGVKAIDLSKLDIGAEFTCVYAPSGQQGWKSVRFMSSDGGYTVKARRELEPREIEHFEALLRQHKESKLPKGI